MKSEVKAKYIRLNGPGYGFWGGFWALPTVFTG